MTDNKLVITVAPQKLICLQGKTYLKNAALIESKSIVTLLDQKWDLLNEKLYSLRHMWRKIKIKNILAPFAWINRKIHL